MRSLLREVCEQNNVRVIFEQRL